MIRYWYLHSCGLRERYEAPELTLDFMPRCPEMGVAPDGSPCTITLYVGTRDYDAVEE